MQKNVDEEPVFTPSNNPFRDFERQQQRSRSRTQRILSHYVSAAAASSAIVTQGPKLTSSSSAIVTQGPKPTSSSSSTATSTPVKARGKTTVPPPPAGEDAPSHVSRSASPEGRFSRSKTVSGVPGRRSSGKSDSTMSSTTLSSFLRMKWPNDAELVTEDTVSKLVSLLWACCYRSPKVLRNHLTFGTLNKILKQAQDVFVKYDNIVIIRLTPDVKCTIVGDTHGQFHDLLTIFDRNGTPSSSNWYVFNGDFVDRGSWGVEICVTLFAYKILYPDYVHILRGNHETMYCTKIYGFLQECKHKYSRHMHGEFQKTFSKIPLGVVILPNQVEKPVSSSTVDDITLEEKLSHECKIGDGKGIFVVHGGLFRNKDGSPGTVPQVQQIDRLLKDPETMAILDILWSDPQPSLGLRENYMRGCATFFGPDITKEFLEKHGLHLMIRSHEGPDAREKRPVMKDNMMEGFAIDQCMPDADGTFASEGEPLLITLFSAPNYPQGLNARGNRAAYIVLKGSDPSMIPEICQFYCDSENRPRPTVIPYPSEVSDLTDFFSHDSASSSSSRYGSRRSSDASSRSATPSPHKNGPRKRRIYRMKTSASTISANSGVILHRVSNQDTETEEEDDQDFEEEVLRALHGSLEHKDEVKGDDDADSESVEIPPSYKKK